MNASKWLRTAPHGATEVYHIGLLMNDRLTNKPLAETATALWHAAKAGLVTLTQRRVTEGVCSYIVTRL